MFDYNAKYNEYLNLFNAELEHACLSMEKAPQLLKDAMIYAVSGGGKRVRPVMCFAAAEMLGVDFDKIKRFAVAIELIHSYSLVHDDLPAMDNDDYRRGKLSTHKKFGEAYGILAGDALLNFAFEYCLDENSFNLESVKALKLLGEYAGATGMIAGQVLDLQNEKNDSPNEQVLYDIYHNKTAKLLTAPLLIASIFAKNKHFDELKDFGYNLGVMFQITDDIMDVEGTVESIGKTPNKDAQVDKLTSVKIFGLDGAKNRNTYHYNECINLIKNIKNNEFFVHFTNSMYKRKK